MTISATSIADQLTLDRQHYIGGCVLVLISAVCYGLQPFFAFFAYNDGTNTTGLLLSRFCISSVVLLGWLKLRGISLPKPKLFIQNLAIGAGYAGAGLGYYNASQSASFSLAVILMFSFPAFVTLFAILFLKEKLTRLRVTSLTLAISGVIFAAGIDLKGDITGILWALFAALSYGSAIIYASHQAKPENPIASAAVIMIAGSLIFIVVAQFHHITMPQTATGWSAVIGLALFATLAPLATFISGAHRIGAANASTLSTMEPVVAVVIAVSLLGEPLSWTTITGGVMVVCAALLLVRQKR
ncbi:DMT family transporter [Amphritea japonica]|nr:DMT family transporter [Amphritea japonica]